MKVQVAGGRAVLALARLPQRVHRLAQRRLDGLSKQARQLLVTAAVLGPAFRLEDAAEMLGETPATLLPAVEETMDAAIMTVADDAFAFGHPLLRRAVGEMIPRPARNALHRQCGEILLVRGESADRTAGHLLQAAHPGDRSSLAGLDKVAAQTLASAPQTAAGLALRALELTPPADPDALARAVAAAEALTAACRLEQAAQIARDMLAKPLPPVAEDRLRCALSSVLNACGHARDAADQVQMVLARPQLPSELRDLALTARYLKEALAGYRQVGADRDQARIRRRLRQLGVRRRHWSTPPARPVTGWHSLTGTEQAVASLVAEGLNNNQVAARMYISTHTVAHHLRQAFRKLSIASRVELTRIVIEQAAGGSLVLIASSDRA